MYLFILCIYFINIMFFNYIVEDTSKAIKHPIIKSHLLSEKPNKFKAIYQTNEVSSSSEEISSDNVDLNDISDCSESNSDKNNSKDEISENESHDEISEENNSCDSDDYDKLFKKVKNLQKKLTKK